MSPQSATVVFAIGILGLFLLDRDRKPQASPALWIPFVWLSICASRTVSEWLGVAPVMESPDQYLEGNPLDRLIFTGLLLVGLAILIARGRRTGTLLRANWPLVVFFLYCLASVMWSDFPLVAFKRWTKALGNVVMVLVVLTDPNPSAAIKRLFARIGFLLIPLSMLLIKYYPELGRVFHRYSGEAMYTGVATGKNGLGAVCLIFGLASLWRLLEAMGSGERPRVARPLIAQGVLLAIVLWLFWMADSVTSLSCFVIGVSLLLMTTFSTFAQKPAAVHLFAGVVVLLSVSVLFLDVGTGLIGAMGRDTTLTGRTGLWADLLDTRTNHWLGTGFESFWLGARAEYFWEHYWWHPNQAHNGYLELFLTVGWIGVALHGLVMTWGYRNIVGSLQHDPALGRLRLAFFMVAIIYNLTEAAFRDMHSMWIAFLLAIAVVPFPPRQNVHEALEEKPHGGIVANTGNMPNQVSCAAKKGQKRI